MSAWGRYRHSVSVTAAGALLLLKAYAVGAFGYFLYGWLHHGGHEQVGALWLDLVTGVVFYAAVLSFLVWPSFRQAHWLVKAWLILCHVPFAFYMGYSLCLYRLSA